ncbi:head-tail adaptor protein [Gehongia tenuis]|uniref:Head-tail adaptor protein n=1 Tax=Gehongia tenuis TaxID=2763655 RepID=A0A926D537_9FIRM|nr:head-tail adaptor protein [Gehongia tenuis]MBC8531751.1 head-tail adaptor protein [Gehongia tenuis]
MSKSANSGELKTAIRVLTPQGAGPSVGGYVSETWDNVFGDGVSVRCKWVNAHGAEAITATTLQLKDPATLTMRYSPKITPKCRIYRGDDPDPYEIISIDNVEERCRWLEIKVSRYVPG